MGKTKEQIELDYYGCDPPDVMQACLNCNKPKCDNCIEQTARVRLSRSKSKKEK